MSARRFPFAPALPLAAAFLACAALAAPAPAAFRGGECPDQMASDVPATTQDGGATDQCFFGIVVFGLEIGLAGPRCPANRYLTPAHGECAGRHHPGTYCEIEGSVEVRMQSCSCLYFTFGRLGVGFPGCRCVEAGSAGTIQDARTHACEPHAN